MATYLNFHLSRGGNGAPSHALLNWTSPDVLVPAEAVHEGVGTKTKRFPLFDRHSRFTDDTVLTVAVAESILLESDLVDTLHDYFHRYPQAGFGGYFIEWALQRRRKPYNSWGNGSAMRVRPVGFAYDTLDDVMQHAERTAAVTHNHTACLHSE